MNGTKARSIATHVEQGLSFFDAAANVPISIRPLAQYYGVASLCRAVTMFCSQSVSEKTLAPGHGLMVTNWDVLSAESPRRGISELSLTVTRGTFNDVAVATAQSTRYLVNSSAPNWTLALEPPRLEVKFSFVSLLGLFPDLWDEYGMWVESRSPDRFELASLKSGTADRTMDWVLKSNSDIETVMPLFPEEETTPTTETNGVHVTTKDDVHFQPVQHFHSAFDVIGDVLLVPPIIPKGQFSGITSMYAASYVMSMLARYRLTDWLAVWRGEKGDSARPLLDQLMSLIGAEFPKLCADAFEAPK